MTLFDREERLAASLVGVEPWYTIRRAANGANHDYIFNHTSGPDFIRGLNADLGIWKGGKNELLSWDGAVNLWEVLDYALKHGGTVDIEHEPTKAGVTIQDVIDKTGALPEHVYNFIANFRRMAREQGSVNLVDPKIKKTEPGSDMMKILWTVGIVTGLGFTAYMVHKFKRTPSAARRLPAHA
jgi:hypothetical protein